MLAGNKGNGHAVSPGPVKIFSPRAASQKPMGQRVPTGIFNDGSSWVLTGIPTGIHVIATQLICNYDVLNTVVTQ